MTTIVILALIAAALFGYSMYAQLKKSQEGVSMPLRIWSAIVGAGAAITALVVGFVNQ